MYLEARRFAKFIIFIVTYLLAYAVCTHTYLSLHITFQIIHFSNILLKVCKLIDSGLISGFVAHGGNGGIEYKCSFKCPLCPRIFSASYKIYNVGQRKRKANANVKAADRCRKPAWYYSSLQTHLNTHIGDEISDEIYLYEENEHGDDGSGNGDTENDLPESNSNQKDDVVAETHSPESPKQSSGNVLPSFESNDNQGNGIEIASNTRTPRKKLLDKFYKELKENRLENSKT